MGSLTLRGLVFAKCGKGVGFKSGRVGGGVRLGFRLELSLGY